MMARVVSLSVLTTLIVILGITFFRVVAPFVLPLFLAGVVALLCRPLFHRVRQRTGKPRVAAGITTGMVLIIITVPALLATLVGTMELYRLAQDTKAGGGWIAASERLHARIEASGLGDRIRHYLPEFPTSEQWPQEAENFLRMLAERTLTLVGFTLDQTLGLLGSAAGILVGVVMFIIALYYFLADGPALLAASETLIPVHLDYQRQLRERFDQVVRAVVMSTFLAATVQGLLTAAALSVVGFRSFFLLFLLSTCAAMIPLAGTWLVWAPCALWLAVESQWPSAIGLSLFGLIVVGTADNVIRTWILNTDARLHPLLAFISVLGGVEAMGLWGVFVGPIVASCLHALVQIFNIELKAYTEEAFSRSPAVSERPANAVTVEPGPPAIAPTPPATTNVVTPPAKPVVATAVSTKPNNG